MRFLKGISVLTMLGMLLAMLPAAVAEQEIVIEMEETVDEALEIEAEEGDLEGIEAFDDLDLSLEGTELELDGLKDNLLISGTEEQIEAPAASNAGGEFEIDEEGTLIRYGGFDKNVVIPDGVKRIGSAFRGYTDLESVSIPSSVTQIGDYAFEGCTALKSINIPDSVTNIGWRAFSGCTALASVKLPGTLKALGYAAFSGCTSLTSVIIPESIESIDSGVFSGCTSLTSIQLPSNLTELPSGMFSDCDSLENLDFLSGVTKISGSLLSDCDGLKNITIPDSVTSIDSNAFSNCKNLEGVTIHSGVTFIDRTAFNGSDNVVIRGTAGSYAESYANGMGIPFNAPVVKFDDSCYDYRDWWDETNKYSVIYINQSRMLSTAQSPADLARELAWSSSSPEIATVDQNGQVNGISQGTTTISVNTADGKGKAAQIKVVVPEPTRLGFRYDPWYDDIKSIEIKLKDTSDIYVFSEIPYKDETKVDMPITLTSSDESIATIQWNEDNKATLKALGLGKATITATTPDGGEASMELTVIRPEVNGIKIDQTGPITLHPGEQYTLTATLSPEGAESALTWYTRVKSVATVSSEGVVTAVAEGDTVISVLTENGYESEITVNVIPLHPHPESVKIDQSGPIKLYPGQKYSLSATLTPADAEAELTWSSWSTDIATVSSEGVVTAVKEGYAGIHVFTDNGYEDSIEIQVLPSPTKITLNKKKATLGVKEKLALKATFTPRDVTTPLTWKSSKPKVATVSKTGVVTARAVGATVITVRTANGKTAKATITVKAAPNKVTLNRSGTVALAVGKALKLKATLPAKTASALTWRSSKPKIASVDQNGTVRALRKGSAVITVKTFNGKTAKVTVTVK